MHLVHVYKIISSKSMSVHVNLSTTDLPFLDFGKATKASHKPSDFLEIASKIYVRDELFCTAAY